MAFFTLFADPTSSAYEQEVDLGILLRLVFQYNDREQSWYIDVEDLEGTPLRSGIKLVNEFPVFRLWQSTPRPKGEIILASNTTDDSDPLEEDLGDRITIFFADEEEF